jgi:hypothetical protein
MFVFYARKGFTLKMENASAMIVIVLLATLDVLNARIINASNVTLDIFMFLGGVFHVVLMSVQNQNNV